jgi:hypothetical protein
MNERASRLREARGSNGYDGFAIARVNAEKVGMGRKRDQRDWKGATK